MAFILYLITRSSSPSLGFCASCSLCLTTHLFMTGSFLLWWGLFNCFLIDPIIRPSLTIQSKRPWALSSLTALTAIWIHPVNLFTYSLSLSKKSLAPGNHHIQKNDPHEIFWSPWETVLTVLSSTIALAPRTVSDTQKTLRNIYWINEWTCLTYYIYGCFNCHIFGSL